MPRQIYGTKPAPDDPYVRRKHDKMLAAQEARNRTRQADREKLRSLEGGLIQHAYYADDETIVLAVRRPTGMLQLVRFEGEGSQWLNVCVDVSDR